MLSRYELYDHEEIMTAQKIVQTTDANMTAPHMSKPELDLDRPLSRAREYPPRADVPLSYRAWSRDYPDYEPVWYESPRLAAYDRTRVPGGWADPAEVSKQEFVLWSRSGYMHSFEGPIEHDVATGRPLNPLGRTGISGRGALGKWGPNHAADAIVTRISPESGLLEVLLIQRREGQWAIPGGMLDVGESSLSAAKRELKEEAGIELDNQHGCLVYQGIGDGPRLTDNAWIETSVYHFHCEPGSVAGSMVPVASSDALQATWSVITSSLIQSLYANHGVLLSIALSQLRLRQGGLSADIQNQLADIPHSPLLTSWRGLRGRIGVLGGTFDPVHNAHVELGRKILREYGLDAVVYVPNGHNPLKPLGPLASSRERVEMLEYALRDEPGLYVSPIESRIPGKSYTIDTIERVKSELNPQECSLSLILGTDALRGLPQWKDCRRLIREVEIIPIARSGEADLFKDPDVLQALEEQFGEAWVSTMKEAAISELPTPLSASEVRSRLSGRGDVHDMVHPYVLAYIERRGLYGGSG